MNCFCACRHRAAQVSRVSFRPCEAIQLNLLSFFYQTDSGAHYCHYLIGTLYKTSLQQPYLAQVHFLQPVTNAKACQDNWGFRPVTQFYTFHPDPWKGNFVALNEILTTRKSVILRKKDG